MSLIALFLAALANVIIGALWYHPNIFGSAWMRIANPSPEAAERAHSRRGAAMLIAFCSGLFSAYVLGLLLHAFAIQNVGGAIHVALTAWLGLSAPPMLGMVLWEDKPFSYYAIVSGNWLASFVVMSIIIFY